METLNELKNYVPRHLRLGVCCKTPEITVYHEEKREIPIVDDNGDVVETRYELVKVPASDVMAKYKVEDFRLSNLQKAGVPLKVVNINRSTSFTISQLEEICKSIDGQEHFVNSVLQHRAEQQSWFTEPEPQENETVEPKND